LFEKQVDISPDQVAIIYKDQRITYSELNKHANRLARYIRKMGIKAGSFIGVASNRNPEMIASLLAILKAGCVYVPMDPVYPKERLQFIIEDASIALILTQKHLQDIFPLHHPPLVYSDAHLAKTEAENSADLKYDFPAECLAYLIYTSGSTGTPKGVSISHKNAAALVQWGRQTFTQEQLKFTLFSTSINFDVSVFELYVPLCSGATIVMADNILQLPEIAQTTEVSLISTVPSAISELIRINGIPFSVNTIHLAGEFLSQAVVDQLYKIKSVKNVYDLYGPTEDTVYATFTKRQPNMPPTIGKPVSKTNVYILNAQRDPVPIGVPGELFLSGYGQAQGYHNRPDLTAEKFIPNPFSGKAGDRMYATGDLCRFLDNGSIQYLGRMDHQVKVHGFRIELGEIETVLKKHPHIKDVVVTYIEQKDEKKLCAYLVPQEKDILIIADIRNYLSQHLPHYMIPAIFMNLEALPLTPSGKIDRKALPDPEVKRENLGTSYAAPKNEKQKKLVSIWKAILSAEEIGIRDNFFELGGDSILSIQVIARAKQAGLNITPRQLFENPTIEKLAAVAEQGVVIHAEQGAVSGDFPATPIQRHFFEQGYTNEHHWNQSVLLKVPQALDVAVLEQVVAKIVEHHDALRLRVKNNPPGRQLYIAEFEQTTPFVSFDLSAIGPETQLKTIAEQAEALQASLDLHRGPIIRVAYFALGGTAADRLLIIIHHLAIDGVSWRILTEDIQLAYAQAVSGQKLTLPPKSTSFKYWAQQLTEFARSKQISEEFEYWRNIPARNESIPVDFPDGQNTEGTLQIAADLLSAEKTRQLLQDAPQAYNTLINELLLTALSGAYKRWSGKETLLVALEGHGREDIIENVDISRTVGWFTSLYPVYLKLSGVFTPAEAIKQIKEQIRRIPQKGLGYGLLRYLSGDETVESTLKKQSPQIVFNYLGQFEQQINETGAFEATNDLSGAERNLENRREFILDISGSVKNGQLHLQMAYSTALYKEATIREFLSLYMEELRNIIAHCLSVKTKSYTPSDFTDVDLEEDEINNLLDELE